MLRGDIRWFRFSAPDKRRPVLVLGNDGALPSFSQVPVVPLSTQARGLSWERARIVAMLERRALGIAVCALLLCSACVPIVLVAGGASAESRKKKARADQDVVYRHYIDNKANITKLETEASCPSALKSEFDTFVADQKAQNENRLGMGSILMTEFSTKLAADISTWRARCPQSRAEAGNVASPVPIDGGATTPAAKDYGL